MPGIREQDERDFHGGPIKRKDERTDELAPEGDGVMILPITGGDEDGRSQLFQDGRDFGAGQRAAELGFAVVDLGVEIGGEFGRDIVLLRFRQPEFHGLKVTIE